MHKIVRKKTRHIRKTSSLSEQYQQVQIAKSSEQSQYREDIYRQYEQNIGLNALNPHERKITHRNQMQDNPYIMTENWHTEENHKQENKKPACRLKCPTQAEGQQQDNT